MTERGPSLLPSVAPLPLPPLLLPLLLLLLGLSCCTSASPGVVTRERIWEGALILQKAPSSSGSRWDGGGQLHGLHKTRDAIVDHSDEPKRSSAVHGFGLWSQGDESERLFGPEQTDRSSEPEKQRIVSDTHLLSVNDIRDGSDAEDGSDVRNGGEVSDSSDNNDSSDVCCGVSEVAKRNDSSKVREHVKHSAGSKSNLDDDHLYSLEKRDTQHSESHGDEDVVKPHKILREHHEESTDSAKGGKGDKALQGTRETLLDVHKGSWSWKTEFDQRLTVSDGHSRNPKSQKVSSLTTTKGEWRGTSRQTGRLSPLKRRGIKGDVSFRWGTTGEKDEETGYQLDRNVAPPRARVTGFSSLGRGNIRPRNRDSERERERPAQQGYADTSRRRTSAARHQHPTSAGFPSITPVPAPAWDKSWHPDIGTATLTHQTYHGSWSSVAGGDDSNTETRKEVLQAHNSPWDAPPEAVHMPQELGYAEDVASTHRLPGVTSGAGCGCWDTVPPSPEIECSCWNVNNLHHVPVNFSTDVSRITLTNVGLQTVRNDSFTRYRTTLKEIVLEKVGELETIEAGAFKGLQHLRSIYIHSAPQLRAMSNLTFNEDYTNLTSIRIVKSGLEMIPTMHMAGSTDIFHMIDLDSNRIRRVHRSSFIVRVHELSINYNLIETVEREAFAGSEIGKLSLKGNVELRDLHPEAFKGIESLRELDLSETSITSLPTLGLTNLEVLHLERTPTLKVFPSVYSFKSIQKANLTYPYHCCAFQFPEQHDPKQYQEFQRRMAEQKFCSEVTSPSSLHMHPTTRPRHLPNHQPNHLPTSAHDTAPGETWGSLEMKGEGVSLYFPSDVGESGHEGGQKPGKRPEGVHLPTPMGPQAQDSQSRPKTRHYSHHSRRGRKGMAIEEQAGQGEQDGKKATLNSQLEEGFMLFPADYQQQQQEEQQRSAALIRDPVEDLIPRPEKRDPVGAAGEGGSIPHESQLGFGAFNHSARRFSPPLTTTRDNTSGLGWGYTGQVWSDHMPPIDSGDDDTYGGPAFPKYENIGGGMDGRGPPIHTGFHGEFPEGFPDDDAVGHDEESDGAGRTAGKHHHQPDSQWIAATVASKTLVVLCGNVSKDYQSVQCHPGPDAFNPCEDIMGNLALRVAVWLVVVTAVVGNLAVMIVLISSKFKMSVSKFLMVNLALADLCMGIYLLIIAAMDLHTIGVYFNYAIDWQNGPGCKVAGFLTVFASELSIFTLTVITSERWYAITYAIHLNKRLKLSMAMKIMVVGWAYSVTMAALPLLGISNYSKTSICLPMDIGDALALSYLVALLLVNGLAFFVITACYASMYCSISRHDATAPHSDLTVAKRMALLVFTDFACWAPIAFFGLTAVAGLPLINVTRAKILLVFFYPLNSCANPYLYAILTKQYRRDLFILLARYGFCTKRAMKYKGAYSSVNNTFPHNTVVNAPTHRNSTLTQITLCDLTRGARTSQGSNNGSLLAATTAGGSQDSLQRNASPLRTPTKPEMTANDTNERLSTVQEMSHSTHSDEDDPTDDLLHPHHHHRHHNQHPHLHHQQHHPQNEHHEGDDDSGSSSSSSNSSSSNSNSSHNNMKQQGGSPHPIKNCYTRLSVTPEQEEILRQAIQETKSKKRKTSKRGGQENGEKGAEGEGRASSRGDRDGRREGGRCGDSRRGGGDDRRSTGGGGGRGGDGGREGGAGGGGGGGSDRGREGGTGYEERGAVEGGTGMVERRGEEEELLGAHKGCGREATTISPGGHSEAIVICEVEINRGRDRHNRSSALGLPTTTRLPTPTDLEEMTTAV